MQDGFECAGHVGEHDIPNFILLSRAREALGGVPFIASGGMADGHSLAAALSLGACGINMGTRFMCTVEAPIHQNIKESIVNATEDDTDLLMRRWTNTARFFRNGVTQAAAKVERESTTGKFEEIRDYVSGARGRQVFLNGDPEYGVSISTRIIRVSNGLRYLQLGLDRRYLHRHHTRYPHLRSIGTADRERGQGNATAADEFVEGGFQAMTRILCGEGLAHTSRTDGHCSEIALYIRLLCTLRV